MEYDMNALLVVGQLHQHWHRHFEVQDANHNFVGLTAYDLSGLNKVSAPTTHKWLNHLHKFGHAEFVEVDHRDNTKKRLWNITNKGLRHWEMLPQSIKNDVYAQCAANWGTWYQKQVKKRYQAHWMKPLFRV